MKFLLWLFLVISLHLNLVYPAPSFAEHPPVSRRDFVIHIAKRQTATPLIVQANSWASDHTPAGHGNPGAGAPSNFVLPPVSEVFKFLADPNAPRPAPAANPQQPIAPPPPPPPPPANNNQPPGAHPPPVPPPAHGNNNPQPPPLPHDAQPPVHPPPPPGRNHSPQPEDEIKNAPTSNENSLNEPAEPPASSPETERRKNLAPVGKLILIALVMAGIITLIFCIYFLVDRRALSCCCRRKRSRRNRAYRLDDEHEDHNHEKDMPPISYPKFVQSPPSTQDQSYTFDGSTIPPIVHPLQNHLQNYNHNYNHNQAVDIAPGLPPATAMSRFPVTAKPYPFAAHGASFSSVSPPPVSTPTINPTNTPITSSPLSPAPRSPLPPPPPPPQPIPVPPPIPGGFTTNATPIHPSFRRARRSSTPAPLLPPNEFFFMPSASEMTVNLHARAKSNPYAHPHNSNRTSRNALGNPIFGHIVARCLPEIKKMSLRSGEHRKSKSISGLVYVVDTEKGGGRRKNKGQGAGAGSVGVDEERHVNGGGTRPVAF